MKRIRLLAGGAGAVALVLLLGAAGRPRVLVQAAPGLWEISGYPGASAPVRRCIADTSSFAQIEHRGQSCTSVVIADKPTSGVVHYTCTNGGFGQTQLTLLTPRSLRIETQGISKNAPFNYVVQARRVGDCPAH